MAASTVFLYWGLTRAFAYGDDDVLRERIQVIRALLRQGDRKLAELKWEIESEWEVLEDPQLYLRIIDERHESFLQTPGMAQLLPPDAFPPAPGPAALSRTVRMKLPSGRIFRLMTAAASGITPGDRWLIQAAFDIREEETLLNRYGYLLIGVLAVSALISLGLAWRITRTAFGPIYAIAETTRQIGTSTLGERIHIPGLPTELSILAENFNTMLDRLDEAFARLSFFSANIAHELRTPLNLLQAEAEHALLRAKSVDEYREVLASSLDEYSRLSRLVDSLLFIAQAESAHIAICQEAVQLEMELRSIADFFEPIMADRSVKLLVSCDIRLRADVDRVLFRRAVTNLVSNAAAWTSHGGSIRLTAVQENSSICVEVADTGVGIAPEYLPHVFDRFSRVDRTRVRTRDHVGLGLSIVKTIMDLHGGSAHIASEPGCGTCVRLLFPQITQT